MDFQKRIFKLYFKIPFQNKCIFKTEMRFSSLAKRCSTTMYHKPLPAGEHVSKDESESSPSKMHEIPVEKDHRANRCRHL